VSPDEFPANMVANENIAFLKRLIIRSQIFDLPDYFELMFTPLSRVRFPFVEETVELQKHVIVTAFGFSILIEIGKITIQDRTIVVLHLFQEKFFAMLFLATQEEK
jgi:hypothetical protein